MASIDELKGLVSSRLGLARSNQFLVELPSLSGPGGSPLGGGPITGSTDITAFVPSIPGILQSEPGSYELNLLCKTASMPGKQILTHDRRIEMINEKVAYGYAVTDITLTFYMLNDYGARVYFDKWRKTIVNEETFEVGYKNDYAKTVKIHQLRKPLLGFQSRGGLNANISIGGGTAYSIELEEAFPTTINQIDFSNDQDGLVECSVSLSYTNWKVIAPSQQLINVGLSF